jgi:pantoate--beta-alanine ligase
MEILRTIAEARTACRNRKDAHLSLALVPTMGALHAGHLSLVQSARERADVVAASVFVNPLQFGPDEDFTRYPRPFEHDCGLLEAQGVALVFAPAPEEMYPFRRLAAGGPTQAGECSAAATPEAVVPDSTFVEVGGLSDKLEGRSRPGHFRGVATVVAKLFHIVEPDLAFFGQKDAQQVVVIRRMVRDLNLPVEIVVCPIVREPDGLAMSSRNAYLDPAHRRAATVLYRALMRMEDLTRAGERDGARLAEAGRRVIQEEPLARLDYLEVVAPETLDSVPDVSSGALVVVAAALGKTRLIDNLLLKPQGKP